MQYPLEKLSTQVCWDQFDEQPQPTFTPITEALGINTRLVVSLRHLELRYDFSDENLVERWEESPYWQFFRRMQFFSHLAQIDHSGISLWHTCLRATGAEAMLKVTLETGIKLKAIKPSDFARLSVDRTVQTKAIRHRTDALRRDRARERLVKTARKEGFKVKHHFVRVGRSLVWTQSGNAHARQMKQAQPCQIKLKTNPGTVLRKVEKQSPHPESSTAAVLAVAKKIRSQTGQDSDKIFSMHAPQGQCIAKGEACKKYEFSDTVSFAVTSKRVWAGSYEPEGEHARRTQAEPADPTSAFSGVGKQNLGVVFAERRYWALKYACVKNMIMDRKLSGNIPTSLWRCLKRRAAIEPAIGPMKNEHRLECNRIAGKAINVLRSEAAINFGKQLRWIGRFWHFVRAVSFALFSGRYTMPCLQR